MERGWIWGALAFALGLVILAAWDVRRGEAASGTFREPAAPKADKSFRDCANCPEMVKVPAGSFVMGSPADEPQRLDGEQQHNVTIPKAFAVGKYAVTLSGEL